MATSFLIVVEKSPRYFRQYTLLDFQTPATPELLVRLPPIVQCLGQNLFHSRIRNVAIKGTVEQTDVFTRVGAYQGKKAVYLQGGLFKFSPDGRLQWYFV
jgi:hypothetical protein